MFSNKDHCNRAIALWKPIRERMYWVIAGIVGDKALAEDVLQEALITAIEKFQTLREEAKFEPWFLTIAIRKAYEAMAQRKAYVSFHDEGYGGFFPAEEFGDSAHTLDYRELVLLILSKLKPETRKYLFYLRYIEDRSLEDIVRITGMKEGTLKSVFFRMKKELAVLLRKENLLHER